MGILLRKVSTADMVKPFSSLTSHVTDFQYLPVFPLLALASRSMPLRHAPPYEDAIRDIEGVGALIGDCTTTDTSLAAKFSLQDGLEYSY